MAPVEVLESVAPATLIRFHHGTDLACANDLFQHGIDQQQAAAWNGSGEFWAATDHGRADWFALSHPDSPPAACFEFELPEPVLQVLLQMNPPGALHHAPNDYEFLPPGFATLNQSRVNPRVVPVP